MSQNTGQTILFDVNGSERLVGELYRHVAEELVVFDDAFDEPHVWPESLDALPDLEAVSELVRRGASAPAGPTARSADAPLRGRFALLPRRDETLTAEHIRALMEREGV